MTRLLSWIKHFFAPKATERDLRESAWAGTRAVSEMATRAFKDLATLKDDLTCAIEEVDLKHDLDQTMMTLTAGNIIKVNNSVAALYDHLGLKAECGDDGIYTVSPRPKQSNRIDKRGKK